MNQSEFECPLCLKIFTKAWTEEEATAELEKNFPGYTKHESGLVCDDCYKKLIDFPDEDWEEHHNES